MRSGVILMSEMTLALIICTALSAGALFVCWLLAGYWVLNRVFPVTLECPGLDVCTFSAQLNWTFFLAG